MEDSRRVVVFAGPSLPPGARPAEPVFEWRPPAVAGDAFALLADPPRAMVLIDGLFDERPAIRHKEMLELMALRVAVIGAASMGALRAAELHTLGMVGVGAIFGAYARGALEGDDEVALAHGPAELNYAPFSEPLINVRATLAAAARARRLSLREARRLHEIARASFYKRRTWAGILAEARREAAIPASVLDGFEAWLPTGRLDLKRRDALAALDVALIAPPPRGALPPPVTPFSLALAREVRRDSSGR